MKKINKIPTILGIVLLLIGTFAGVFLLRTNQIFKIGASATSTPKDIRVSNLTDSSTTITWITTDATAGFISYGETENVGTILKESESDQKYLTHSITLTGLKAKTTYFYKINSNGTNFDNNGIPWQFTTGAAISGEQKTIPISGSVITASGQPSRRAIVYITVNGYLISTTTSDAGSFVMQLGSVRSSSLSQYADINMSQTLLEVSVEAENGDMARALIFPQSANPIPTLVIGQTQDYRNLQPTGDGLNPGADLNLPEGSTSTSKFNISGSTTSASSKTVILESLDEGETITSTQPEFFGKGPKGETITITVHSQEVISETVKIPTSGSWNWAPPTNLEEGSHTVTISWIDATGITRTLTRNFVVQAGELPSYSASLSGKTATPVPTASPKIISSPTPTLKATVAPTKIASPTASASSIPVTGDLTPTLLLFMMGVVVLSFSVFVWKTSES